VSPILHGGNKPPLEGRAKTSALWVATPFASTSPCAGFESCPSIGLVMRMFENYNHLDWRLQIGSVHTASTVNETEHRCETGSYRSEGSSVVRSLPPVNKSAVGRYAQPGLNLLPGLRPKNALAERGELQLLKPRTHLSESSAMKPVRNRD
jgi:hypothetical protein